MTAEPFADLSELTEAIKELTRVAALTAVLPILGDVAGEMPDEEQNDAVDIWGTVGLAALVKAAGIVPDDF